MKLILEVSPHIRAKEDTVIIMHTTFMIMLLPAIGAVYFFGLYALRTILVSIITAVLTEYIYVYLRFKDKKIASTTAFDGSAMITGLLLALTLPPRIPVWEVIVGSAFAIIFGKQVYGGLGQNIFNPALIGRAFMMIAFPVDMTTWYPPGWHVTQTCASPLAKMKFMHQLTSYKNLFWGNIAGSIGETSAFLIIISGIILILKNYIDWRLPLSYIGTVFVLGGILWLINPNKYPDPLFHVLAGGLLFGAFFMITDMVTSPLTPKGRIIYGILAGIVVIIIRIWGGYPEGVMFSILFANIFRPLIDRWVLPKKFGEVKK